MNPDRSSSESVRAPATPASTVNSRNGHEPEVQLNGAPQKCVICGDPTAERCFCKIHRKEGGPVLLCCPSCTIQYLDSKRPPADSREEELRAGEKNFHFFIGENKPWT